MSRKLLVPFQLPADPTNPLEAATKQYVDSTVAAGAGVVPWIDVGFANSWTNYGSGFQTCQYRKIGDVVTVRGLISSGNVPWGIFQLAVGYRPPATLIFPVDTANSVHGRVDIGTDGWVLPTVANSAYLSLTGISFSVTA